MESHAVFEALARVLGSEGFTRNERQSQFLTFLVERELSGQHRDLKESVLAVEVFGRRPDYDPKVDGIVRTEALRLRARLAKYYESEGRDDPAVIELPKGGYRPVFRERVAPVPDPEALVSAEDDAVNPQPGARAGWRMRTFLGLAAIVVAAIGAAWASGFALRPGQTPRVELSQISFVIPPAPGTMWDVFPADPSPAVSPDGRYVAAVAKSDDGRGVWLHDVQSGSATLLANTGSSAASPFWAPDSTAVAFCDPAGVRVIGIASRAAEIVKAPPCDGGSWHPSGGWLLTTPVGLVRMATPGALPVQITHLDSARGELRHSFGNWLPDGQHFMFLMLGRTPDVRGIHLGAIDSTVPRRLLLDYSRPAYVSEGDGCGLLLFIRGSTLVGQRFDERTLVLTGQVFPLGDRVRVGIVGRGASFSVSDRLLVYRSGAAYQPTRLIWVDRVGRELSEIGPDTAYRLGPSLSADERTLIYGRFNGDTNNIELWTTDLTRSISEPFLRPGYSVESPAWSPDGRTLAFLSAEGGNQTPYVVTPGSSEPRSIAPASGWGQYLEWTADSRFLLRRLDGDVRGFSISGDPKEITALPHDAEGARVSPDGRWVAYSMIEATRPEVYIEHFGGGGRIRVSTEGGFSPRWRADGRELFFRAPQHRMISVSVRLGDTAEIGTPQLLFRAAFEEYGSALAGNPDYLVTRRGDRFLITLPVVQLKPLTAKLNWRSMLPAQ